MFREMEIFILFLHRTNSCSGIKLYLGGDFFLEAITLKLALFILPIYCTLWIIGTVCFYGMELWKMNLFSYYFINSSFPFLFIVTSIITMSTLLLLSLFLLMLPVLFSLSCVVCSWFCLNYCCRCCCCQYVFYLW